MIRTVDRYVFVEWVKIFILVLGAMFGLQFIMEVQDSFTELLGYEASFKRILYFYIVSAPGFLVFSLPAAILVSILYALGVLHRNNELIAFRASGMSVFGVTRSIWIAGLLLSVCLWYLNASLIPWSEQEARQTRERMEWEFEAKSVGEEQVGLVYTLAFDNRKQNRMWFMNRFSEFTQTRYGITVSILDEQRRETRRVSAAEGFYNKYEKKWTMKNGRDSYYAPEDGELIRTLPFDELILNELREDPELMLLFGERPDKLSFLEVKRITDNFTKEENPKVLAYQVRLHTLLASAASCLIVTGLAIPFAISGIRVNPAVGVSKSIGLFFSFYIMVNILKSLAQQEYLSPAVAAWTPNVTMIVLAYVLLRRVK